MPDQIITTALPEPTVIEGGVDISSWLGSTAPTVGQKDMEDSLPVVIAADQTPIPVTVQSMPTVVVDISSIEDFNLARVGGEAVSLGAKPSEESIPVVLPTDQTLSIQGSVCLSACGPVDYVYSQLPEYAILVAGSNGSNLTPLRTDDNGVVQIDANSPIPVTDNDGSLTVDGAVSVSNFPTTQSVSIVNEPIQVEGGVYISSALPAGSNTIGSFRLTVPNNIDVDVPLRAYSQATDFTDLNSPVLQAEVRGWNNGTGLSQPICSVTDDQDGMSAGIKLATAAFPFVYNDDENKYYKLRGNANGILTVESIGEDVTWREGTSLNTGRYGGAAAVVDGILYAIGGYVSGGPTGIVEAYNPSLDTWSTKTPMTTPRGIFAIGVLGTDIYVAGGDNGSALATLEVYHTLTDTWTTLASMNLARSYFSGAFIGGKFYITGGSNGGVFTATCEVYDPATNAWAYYASLPEICDGHETQASNGLIYVVGGLSNDGVNPGYYVRTVRVYNPATNNWSIRGCAMPDTRQMTQATTTGNLIWMPGGYGEDSGNLNTVAIYDTVLDHWISVTTLPDAIQQPMVAAYNNTIYIIGGMDSVEPYRDTVYILDRTSNKRLPVTPVPISYATPRNPQYAQLKIDSSGLQQTLIPGAADQTIAVHRLFMTTDAPTTVSFESGHTENDTGPLYLTQGGSVTLDLSPEPWFVSVPGSGLSASLTANAQLSGRIYYTQF